MWSNMHGYVATDTFVICIESEIYNTLQHIATHCNTATYTFVMYIESEI